MAEETLSFQTEVSRLLRIVANSLYSEKRIFMRELISNASDACDRLRYEALAEPGLIEDDPEFRVRIELDAEARTVSVVDNGIGMNREGLIADLGTIARSGTTAYLEQVSGDAADDMALIGQFGVGFYSAFMVADRVEVVSRRAGEDAAWRWASDGLGEFSVGEAERAGRGTTVTLHMRDGEDGFLDPASLRGIVKTYSDHIALPIVLVEGGSEETVNEASALWTRPRGEIDADQYGEFYRHVGHAFDEPWMTVHWRAEGVHEYTTLVFIPSQRPFDLFDPQRRHGVKLYVKRVFVTDDCAELVPQWLRFLRGLVDSEDLPLNISREMLQNNPLLARMRAAIVRRVLGELAKKAEAEPESYAGFWENFGPVLKEGLYEDADNRDELLKLARFHTTADGGPVGLDAYVERMREGQEAIYYIAGEALDAVRQSPQLEGFRARGIEVLLMTDPVDEFWIPAVGAYSGKEFKSATRAGADLADIAVESEAEGGGEAIDQGRIDSVIAMFKLALKDEVKDVRTSDRLTDSAACLVADEGDLDINLERLLKQHRQLDTGFKRILEINPSHALIRSLADAVGKGAAAGRLADTAWLVLDQARIMEGETPPDPAAFSRRMSEALARGLEAG
ncbi:MAG: molecular chaperone HtpG [Defluviicoccus sp.]|nr:molecular chaperone HtpG [Defluviicoccus sp.]